MNNEQKIKCDSCGISIPAMPERTNPDDLLCNGCYDFNELTNEEAFIVEAQFESTRAVQAHALYFINTGEFYEANKLTHEALNMFIDNPMPELAAHLDEIALAVFQWIEWSKDYYKSFNGTDVKIPTRGERKLIAAEIIDHWTERKITKEINKLL